MYGELTIGVTVPPGQTTVSASFGPTTRSRTWTVSQVSIYMPSAVLGSTCQLLKNGVFVSWLVASGDVAGSGPPMVLNGLEKLTVAWTGLTAGAVGTVLAIYDEVK